MDIVILFVFIIGFLFIVLEYSLKIDKAASALLTGGFCWTLYALSISGARANENLLHHMIGIASILFFLLGAMTIVELVDAHDGFSIMTDMIKTRNKVQLLWITGTLTFSLSALLDNLTTAIVMISVMKKLIEDRETRLFYAGIVVIAANAGGAWSPIGDVTTTMLWIKGQLPHAGTIVMNLFIPSLVCLVVPLIILSIKMKGEIKLPQEQEMKDYCTSPCTFFERNLIFSMGLAGMLFVPIFKTITHLPPFMGMMLSLGVLWMTTEVIHRNKTLEEKGPLSVLGVLRKIDTASILFFLGILLAVSTLQEIGLLGLLASTLGTTFTGSNGLYIINIMIGILSSVVDNVPLVAAVQGMYPIATATGPFASNGIFWQFLAYCAGTGGSAFIIGSAAGIAVMGLERMDFIWYFKRITLLAVIGYLAGAATFILIHTL
jgi:Na+/H+ antiporter NhaD/arsenite permease-like protein